MAGGKCLLGGGAAGQEGSACQSRATRPGGRAPDLPAWGRKRPGGEERLPWQLGGRRVREVERLSDSKREVGPRGACHGSRAGGMPRGALGGCACEGSWEGGPGRVSSCQTLQLARRRTGGGGEPPVKAAAREAGPGGERLSWRLGRRRAAPGGGCQGRWAGGVPSGGAVGEGRLW